MGSVGGPADDRDGRRRRDPTRPGPQSRRPRRDPDPLSGACRPPLHPARPRRPSGGPARGRSPDAVGRHPHRSVQRSTADRVRRVRDHVDPRGHQVPVLASLGDRSRRTTAAQGSGRRPVRRRGAAGLVRRTRRAVGRRRQLDRSAAGSADARGRAASARPTRGSADHPVRGRPRSDPRRGFPVAPRRTLPRRRGGDRRTRRRCVAAAGDMGAPAQRALPRFRARPDVR